MSWLRLDDGYDTHPKLLELTELNRWRWTRVLLHCARHRTDGHVTLATIRELGLGRAVPQLLDLALLDMNGDGYVVHGWNDFNPKDPTKAERQARWRSKTSTDPSTPPSTDRLQGDADVDTATVYTPVSRARARARGPVPSPTPTSKPKGSTRVEDQVQVQSEASYAPGLEPTASALHGLDWTGTHAEDNNP